MEKPAETEGTRGNSDQLPDAELCAKLVLREGKPFMPSALQAGYSEGTARRGLKAWVTDSRRAREAFKRESDRMSASLDKLKPHAVNRLFQEIIDLDSGQNGLRAIEIAGKFKETDWFVRSTELNLGVFVGLQDSSAGETAPNDDTKE